MITSMGMLLSNLKAFLMMFAFIKPNAIERRQCINNSTILRQFDVRVDLTTCLEDVQKVFIRQRMIHWGIVEYSFEIVIMNQME